MSRSRWKSIFLSANKVQRDPSYLELQLEWRWPLDMLHWQQRRALCITKQKDHDFLRSQKLMNEGVWATRLVEMANRRDTFTKLILK